MSKVNIIPAISLKIIQCYILCLILHTYMLGKPINVLGQ